MSEEGLLELRDAFPLSPAAAGRHAGRNRARWRPGWEPGQAYRTPAYVLEPIRAAFGGVIGLDPCTEPDNPTRAERFYALPTDGLAESWAASSVFVNPPFGDARRPWVVRCLELGQATRTPIVLLIPAMTEVDLVQSVLRGAHAALFVSGRLTYEGLRPNMRQAATASHGTLLAGWNVDLSRTGLGALMVPA